MVNAAGTCHGQFCPEIFSTRRGLGIHATRSPKRRMSRLLPTPAHEVNAQDVGYGDMEVYPDRGDVDNRGVDPPFLRHPTQVLQATGQVDVSHANCVILEEVSTSTMRWMRAS